MLRKNNIIESLSMCYYDSANDVYEEPVPAEFVGMLEYEEPNIRWDAAIALAKMGEITSAPIIENLMDRSYLTTFPELDPKEINKVILTAIETSSLIEDNRFEPRLVMLAESDESLKVRDAAIKTLKKSYNRII